MTKERVVVPGSEWPGTEWDTPDAWYRGTVQRRKRGSLFVTFDGEDEEIEFTRESLDTYREMHDAYKMKLFDTLVEAALLLA